MREVAFLKKNKDKWNDFETLLKAPKLESADVIADLYIKISNDLAFAQSNFPNSKTVDYLNDLGPNFQKLADIKSKPASSGWF